MKKTESLTAILNTFHYGNFDIEFIPSSNIHETKLMKIAFLYIAKVRFLLETEPPDLKKWYLDLFKEIIKPSEWSPIGKITERLEEIVFILEMQAEDLPDSEMEERFLINLIESEEIDYVLTEIPLPGLAVNIPISAIVLTNAVTSRLSFENLGIFESQLSFFMKPIFEIEDFDLLALKKLNKEITTVMNFADEITDLF